MFNFNLFNEPTRPFNTMYRCYSVSMMPGAERSNADRGGRIFLPPSALDQLSRLNIVYPMLFRLSNSQVDRVTHCGVLEFVADEGKCYLPYWMMKNLLLEEGSMLNIESVSLPVATFSKFRPQSADFLDISNPKAVLENELRHFACLTTGDVIAINYNDRVYELQVLETKPQSAVSIIECDMQVDFAAPIGYEEPTNQPSQPQKQPDKKESKEPEEVEQHEEGGYRIDGKSTKRVVTKTVPAQKKEKGQPDYDFKPGFIKFFH